MMKKLFTLLIGSLSLCACHGSSQRSHATEKGGSGGTEQQQSKGDSTVAEGTVIHLTAALFKERIMDYEKNPKKWVFKGSRPALVDFYATWCGPCKRMAPEVEKAAKKYAGKVDIYKVDVDQESELASLFNIQSIPTLLFIPMEGEPEMQVGGVLGGQLDKDIQTKLLKKK